ncbi:hypothetical protein ACWJJH_02925 [Endozoicomonadaceae bacterium StTr2]
MIQIIRLCLFLFICFNLNICLAGGSEKDLVKKLPVPQCGIGVKKEISARLNRMNLDQTGKWVLPSWYSSGSVRFLCDPAMVKQTDFFERYKLLRHISQSWYAHIYQVQHNADGELFAIKVVCKSHQFSDRFQSDIDNLQACQGVECIIQMKEYFDFGETGVIVTEWADADAFHQNDLLMGIRDDKTFRVLAKQLLECVGALDRRCLLHKTVEPYDFLYFRSQGQGVMKVSALERAEMQYGLQTNNFKALISVFRILENLLEESSLLKSSLGEESIALMNLLKKNIGSVDSPEQKASAKRCASELLQHSAFFKLEAGVLLEL